MLLSDEVRDWLAALVQRDPETALLIRAAIRVLRQDGPALGRPLVDNVKGSRIKNLKELRPGSSGRSEIRILFAFDPLRRAILLVAGDKSSDWTGWYRQAIKEAELAYAEHLRAIAGQPGESAADQ
ncbi:MAG: type II toxin-antitoxin system RelE/ParE family toxin [Streptosporangiaceae bacterium]